MWNTITCGQERPSAQWSAKSAIWRWITPPTSQAALQHAAANLNLNRKRKMKRNLKPKIETQKFEVELTLYRRIHPEKAIRTVEVATEDLERKPSLNWKLSRIFIAGQNDFQPLDRPSVSMGDIIRYHGSRYLILAINFRKLKPGQFVNTQPQLTDVLPRNSKSKKLENILTK
jgi:hypothetical protein